MLSLQKIAGKCVSTALAVPGAILFTNEINLALARCAKSSRPQKLEGTLRLELEHWLSLENYNDVLPWRSQRHHHIKLFTDSSSYGWGGLLSDTAVSVEISDYWDHATRSKDIVVKESLALANVLLAFQDSIRNSWIDVFSDSEVLVKACRRQCARSPAFIAALKRVFAVLSLLNAEIQLFHIRSEDNPADHPSRRLSLQDAKLNSNKWEFIQHRFGGENGHSVDLMALPSNCQLDLEGKLLPFFSPYPTPLCAA